MVPSARSQPSSRLLWVGLVAVCLTPWAGVPASSAADQPVTTPAPLVDRVEVNVVNVEVSVTDAAGEPIRDLEPQDFTIREDGVQQTLSNFYLIDDHRVRAGLGSAAERIGPQSPFRRRAVLLIDNNNVGKVERDRAVEAARDFIGEKFDQSYEWAVLAVGDRVQVVQPLTDQKFVVQAALDRVKLMPTFEQRYRPERRMLDDPTRAQMSRLMRDNSNRVMSPSDVRRPLRFESRFSAERNLIAAKRVAEGMLRAFAAYGGLDGQKVLVMVTGGIELLPELDQVEDDPGGLAVSAGGGSRDPTLQRTYTELRALIAQVARAANAAQFRIYPLAAGGLSTQVPQFDASVRLSAAQSNPSSFGAAPEVDDHDSAQLQLASATGGIYLPTNDPRLGFETIDRDASTYYSLGYTPGHVGDGLYHRIEVAVNRPGARVRARQGYIDLSPQQRLEQALSAPLTFEKEVGTLPVKLAVHREPGREVTATASLPMRLLSFVPREGREVGRVWLFLSVYDGQGELVDLLQRTRDLEFSNEQRYEARSQDFSYALRFAVAERGRYTVAMTVYDEISGEVGTAFVPLEV